MADDEKEEQFLHSRVNTDLESRKDLSNATIANYAQSTLQMLKYIDDWYTDRQVQDGLKVAFTAVCNVECNAQKMACHIASDGQTSFHTTLQMINIMDKKECIVDLDQIY